MLAISLSFNAEVRNNAEQNSVVNLKVFHSSKYNNNNWILVHT